MNTTMIDLSLNDYFDKHPLITDYEIIDRTTAWVIITHSGGSFITMYVNPSYSETKGLLRDTSYSEGSTPPLHNCPIRLLRQVPALNVEWRDKVYAYHGIQKCVARPR